MNDMAKINSPNRSSDRQFLVGWRKWLLFVRVALHVLVHFVPKALFGSMPLRTLPQFLYRALLFLGAVRHNKVVRRGKLYKLQLYIPAYPTPAFFHALEKLYRPNPGPTSVVLGITRACSYHCPHCYQGRDSGLDLDQNHLIELARQMQDRGISFFNVEGGEPLLCPDRLINLVNSIDTRGEVWVNTTGAHLNDELLDALSAANIAGVMVSIHSASAAEHDAFTGVPGSFDVACRALQDFAEKGFYTAINCCPDSETGKQGAIDEIFKVAYDCRCDYVQVIHRKAAGNWLGNTDLSSPSSAAIKESRRSHLIYNSEEIYRDYPAAAFQVFDEDSSMFGCTAGGVDRFYIGASGEVQPCEFLNISFGNVRDERFSLIFDRMRSYFKEPCTDWLCCTKASAIEEIIKEYQLEETPVPWEITQHFISKWDRGAPTPLYRRLGIYR